MYEQEKVLPHIVEALQSPYEGVKYWAAQIAADFPDDILFEPLIKLVKSEDEIERMSDVEIKEFVEEVLEDIRN